MKDLIDVAGASGAVYRFARLRDGRPLSAMGGNYVYTRESGEAPEIVFAGVAQNLLTDAHERWDEAVRAHDAAQLFTRLNVSQSVRQHEQEDILEACRPPMNGPADADPTGPSPAVDARPAP